MVDKELWVDDLYDMTEEQIQHEADRYKKLARFGPDAEKLEHQFAYYRHKAASELLEAIRR